MQWSNKIEVYFSLTEQPEFQVGRRLSSMLPCRDPGSFCPAFPPFPMVAFVCPIQAGFRVHSRSGSQEEEKG